MEPQKLFRTCKRIDLILSSMSYSEREFVLQYHRLEEEKRYGLKCGSKMEMPTNVPSAPQCAPSL